MLTAEEAIRMVPVQDAGSLDRHGRHPNADGLADPVADGDAGILTGVMLAVARAAGETAPLLFTALFSNYWIVTNHQLDLDAAHGLDGRADLQFLRRALSKTRSRFAGRHRWSWS